MKYGARTKLSGRVVRIKKGGVMAQVDLQLEAAGPMSSVLTLDSLREIGVKKGDRVRVIVTAVHVLLARE
jgi:molybdate transport system regulatory protein